MPWPYPWPGDPSGPQSSAPAADIAKKATYPQPSKEDWNEGFLAPGYAAALKAVEKPVYPAPLKRLGPKALGLGGLVAGYALGVLANEFAEQLQLDMLFGPIAYKGYSLNCACPSVNPNGWHHIASVHHSAYLAGCPVSCTVNLLGILGGVQAGEVALGDPAPADISRYEHWQNAAGTTGALAKTHNWHRGVGTTIVEPYRPVIVVEPAPLPGTNIWPDLAVPGDPALFPAALPYELLPALDPAVNPLADPLADTKPHPWTWPGGLTVWPSPTPGVPPDLSWDIDVDVEPSPAPHPVPVPSPEPSPLPAPDGPVIGGYSPGGPWGGGNTVPAKGNADVKAGKSKGTAALAAAAGAVTEGLDVLEAAWTALPSGLQTKVKGVQTSPWQKFKDVRGAFQNDADVLAADGYIGKFAGNLAKNAATDLAVGSAAGALAKQHKKNPAMRSRPVGHMVGPWDNPASVGNSPF